VVSEASCRAAATLALESTTFSATSLTISVRAAETSRFVCAGVSEPLHATVVARAIAPAVSRIFAFIAWNLMDRRDLHDG
jgi:hypothetical protein